MLRVGSKPHHLITSCRQRSSAARPPCACSAPQRHLSSSTLGRLISLESQRPEMPPKACHFTVLVCTVHTACWRWELQLLLPHDGSQRAQHSWRGSGVRDTHAHLPSLSSTPCTPQHCSQTLLGKVGGPVETSPHSPKLLLMLWLITLVDTR